LSHGIQPGVTTPLQTRNSLFLWLYGDVSGASDYSDVIQITTSSLGVNSLQGGATQGGTEQGDTPEPSSLLLFISGAGVCAAEAAQAVLNEPIDVIAVQISGLTARWKMKGT